VDLSDDNIRPFVAHVCSETVISRGVRCDIGRSIPDLRNANLLSFCDVNCVKRVLLFIVNYCTKYTLYLLSVSIKLTNMSA